MWIHRTYENIINSSSSINRVFFESSIIPSENRMISYFVRIDNSSELIFKTYNSLLQQNYKNWELIIIDTSNNSECNIPQNDLRIKYFKINNPKIIGQIKNYASRLCTGYIICELNNGDEIISQLTSKLHDIYSKNNDIIFVSANCCQFNDNKSYSSKYSSYIYEYYLNKWRAIEQNSIINNNTINDIPNNLKTWRASTLFNIGFNNSSLNESSDYELMIRTILYCSENNKNMIHLPIVGCYRHEQIENNKPFQNMLLYNYFYGDLIKKSIENIQSKKYHGDNSSTIISSYNCFSDEYKVTIVITTYNEKESLLRVINSCLNQTYQNFEIIVICDKFSELEDFMINEYNGPKEKIRWWNLSEDSEYNRITSKNYILRTSIRTNFICYLEDDNIYTPTNLENLINKFKDDPNLGFVFSSMKIGEYKIICKDPIKYRINTSTFMHKKSLLDKHGYWKEDLDDGYEIISRWINGGEKWEATKKPTVIYNLKNINDPLEIYQMYNDQIFLDKIKRIAFCLICIEPDEKWLEFLSKFKYHDIYIMVDNINYSTYKSYDNIKIIRISENECKVNGFIDTNFTVKKLVTGWEKAIYYFSNINCEYEHVWFCEDDVFFFDDDVIKNIDSQYPNSDLLSNEYEINVNGVGVNGVGADEINENNWIWTMIKPKINPPYYKAMMCICRISNELLSKIDNYAKYYKTLFFLEALFPTICMVNKLKYDTPKEFENVVYRKDYTVSDIKNGYLYHPIKDINKHTLYRESINKINIFALCFNEALIIPHMVAHYRKYLPSCKITIYDNESTDNSVEIAKSLGCEVISWSSNNKFDDFKNLEIKNNCWKVIDNGWVIIIDMDEFLCVTEDQLLEEMRSGTTFLDIEGLQMIGESLVEDISDIDLQQITKYIHNEYESKRLCFYRNDIWNINYSAGCHTCNPVGKIKYSSKKYYNKHMCYLGLPFLINRYKQRFVRSKEQRELYGRSFHYKSKDDEITEIYEKSLSLSLSLPPIYV